MTANIHSPSSILSHILISRPLPRDFHDTSTLPSSSPDSYSKWRDSEIGRRCRTNTRPPRREEKIDLECCCPGRCHYRCAYPPSHPSFHPSFPASYRVLRHVPRRVFQCVSVCVFSPSLLSQAACCHKRASLNGDAPAPVHEAMPPPHLV